MTDISRTPIYNLSAVLKETGLHADVLRAWERRYELPHPQRTSGGHRLYSEYDLATIKWLRERQAEGFSISRAVELWKEISNTGQDPLSGYPLSAAPESQPVLSDNNQIDMLRTTWLKNCLNFDSNAAETTVNQAFAIYPVETVCMEILQKGINEVGQLWYENKATIQQEHFASALAARRIETLISATPAPTRKHTLLVGCPEGEWHSLPALILTLLLRRRGWNVVYLGSDLPLVQMEQTAAVVHPDLIILAAQQLRTASKIMDAAILFQKLHIPLAYGGLIFNSIPDLRKKIPASYLGETLEAGIDQIERLLNQPVVFYNRVEDVNNHQAIAAIFRSKLPRIEANLLSLFTSESITSDNMNTINVFFAASLGAALDFGNPSFLEHDLEWVKRLLVDRMIPTDQLIPYLSTYQQSVSLEMGNDGTLITGWITSYLERIKSAND